MNLEYKHTPAPWNIEYDNDEFEQWFNVGPAKVPFPYNQTAEEMDLMATDAALISAAPHLLTACLSAYGILQKLGHTIEADMLLMAIDKSLKNETTNS